MRVPPAFGMTAVNPAHADGLFTIRWGTEDTVPWFGPAAAVALVAAGLLALFGLPPLDLHSPLHRIGVMDPLCGGTRAARFLMTGDWLAAWQYNPGIFVLSAALGVGLTRWFYGLASGRWVRLGVPRRPAIFVLVVGVVILDVNQQFNAELLMR